jgi:hypothetical protein
MHRRCAPRCIAWERRLERFPIQLNPKALQVFDFVVFSTENRCPLFRKMLYVSDYFKIIVR